MNKVLGLLTRIFLGKHFAILLKLLLLVPQTAGSIEPDKDKATGKYVEPFPEPNTGEITAEIHKMLPKEARETASRTEMKQAAYHIAKSYQYIKALFN